MSGVTIYYYSFWIRFLYIYIFLRFIVYNRCVVCTHLQVINETSARKKRNNTIQSHHVTTSKELKFINEGKKRNEISTDF